MRYSVKKTKANQTGHNNTKHLRFIQEFKTCCNNIYFFIRSILTLQDVMKREIKKPVITVNIYCVHLSHSCMDDKNVIY